MTLQTLPPLSLYIHYPWCLKKCPYCDFNSHQGKSLNGYMQALLDDLDGDLQHLQQRPLQSIFIGGGTPSLMTVAELKKLFSGLKKRMLFTDDIEISMEANPSTFEAQKFKQFRQIGINRLSIGVQSFNDKFLKSLGRVHNADEAIEAIKQGKKAGFDNLNIDLMYGLEGQTLAQCLADLKQAISLKPSHISFYQLTIEANTWFAKYPPKLPTTDSIFRMGEAGLALLQQHGFSRYEVSAYSKNSKSRCKHNLNYWQFGDYIGIGAGACGKITNLISGQVFRTLKPKSPKDFINKLNPETTLVNQLSFEFMLNALRLKYGFDLQLFTSRTGIALQTIKPKLEKAQDLGLLILDDKHIKPSEKGYNFLDDLIQIFL